MVHVLRDQHSLCTSYIFQVAILGLNVNVNNTLDTCNKIVKKDGDFVFRWKNSGKLVGLPYLHSQIWVKIDSI